MGQYYTRSESHQATLSHELTVEQLGQLASAGVAQVRGVAESQDWDTITRAESRTGMSQTFSNQGAQDPERGWYLATRYADDSQTKLEGSFYRLVAATGGPARFRWAEVFYPRSSESAPQVTSREATVGVGNVATPAFHVVPPATNGEIRLEPLAASLRLITPSMSPVPGEPRLYLPDALFNGQVAEVDAQTQNPYATTAAIITLTGDVASLKLVAVDPQILANQGQAAAIAQGVQIPSGTDLWALPNRPGVGNDWDTWILLAVGLAPSTIEVKITMTTLGQTVATTKVLTIFPRLELAVDANRDGEIKLAREDTSDATSASTPYRFWSNDDDDAITGSSDSDRVPRQSQDWTDHRIECERDLEDFARLQIYTQGLNEAFKNGDLHLGLKWTNTTGTPAIQIFKNRETDGGTGYLNTINNPNLPQQLVQWAVVDAGTESQGPIAGQRTIEGSGVFILPSSLFSNLTDAQPKTHLLFEGCKPGKGQLKLVILKKEGASYTEIGEGPGVWLDLKSIKSMYEGPGTAFEQPVGETPQGIVFVHGWNMSPDGSVNFAETMFKRLWHRGFKGRFVSLRWNTNYSDAFDNVPLIGEAVEGYLADYNGSERVAWQSGAIVKAAVDGLPAGYSRNIVAHSMGNIIAGSALLAGVSFDNYVLMQAAVPASCYDDRALLQQAERPSPQTYAGFRPTFWEAGVSPDDDPVPETRALSYRGRLSASVGNLVSFYLPDDHATTYAWEFNNDQTKPISGYGYTRGAPVVLGSQRAIWRQIGTGPSAFQDSLTDPFVAMPFVCRSWSKVVGADSRTAGVIQGSFNLNSSPLFFDTEHSAQFNRSIQTLRPFYDELLRRLGMEPTP